MAAKAEEPFMTNRELISRMSSNIEHLLGQQAATNIELVRQSGIQTQLLKDSESAKTYIKDDVKWKENLRGKIIGFSLAGGIFGGLIKYLIDLTKH